MGHCVGGLRVLVDVLSGPPLLLSSSTEEGFGRAVMVPVPSVHRVAPPAPAAPAPEQAPEQEEQEEDEDEEPEREEEEREVPESRAGPDDRPDDDSDHNCDADQEEEPCDPPTDEPSMPIPVMIRLHACHGGCHREDYRTSSIYAYRISDTGKPIRMVRDKYRLSDTILRRTCFHLFAG